jgi:hypothetical protein
VTATSNETKNDRTSFYNTFVKPTCSHSSCSRCRSVAIWILRRDYRKSASIGRANPRPTAPQRIRAALAVTPRPSENRAMGLLNGIWLAVLGVLGASSIIVARKPDAKEIIAKLAPYQGWIGVVSAFWGIWGVIQSLLNLGTWLKWAPVLWLTWLADSLLLLALGFILGIGTMKTFIKDPKANEKMDQTLHKLLPYQGTLGLIAIGVGLWMVVAGFMWRFG